MPFEEQPKPQTFPDEVLEKTNSLSPENYAFDLSTLRIDLKRNLDISPSVIDLDLNKDRKLSKSEVEKSLVGIEKYDSKIDYLFGFLINYFLKTPEDYKLANNWVFSKELKDNTDKTVRFYRSRNPNNHIFQSSFDVYYGEKAQVFLNKPYLSFCSISGNHNYYPHNYTSSKSLTYYVKGHKDYDNMCNASFRSENDEFIINPYSEPHGKEKVPPFLNKENLSRSYYEIMLKAIQIHLALYPEI